jgi:hypothetical protein
MGCSSISRIPDEYSEVRDTIARSVFEVVKRKLPSGTVYSGWSSDRRNLNGFYIDFEMPGAAGTRRLRLRYSSGVGQNEYRMVEYKGKISLK